MDGITNPDGKVVEDVPSLRRFTGQSYEEAKGSGWAKALHPDDVERTVQAWNNAVVTRSAYEIEYRMRRHDGTYRDLLARGFPVFMTDGNIREWVGTCIDITERKIAEQQLHRTLDNLRKSFGATVQVMVSAVEMRDPYTAGHQLRVADWPAPLPRRWDYLRTQ